MQDRDREESEETQRREEERQRREEESREREEAEEGAGEPEVSGPEDPESDAGSTVSLATGKRKDLGSYNFTAEEEQNLVEFFQDHDCLYSKGSDNYANTQYKNRLLGDMARDLRCKGEKILHNIYQELLPQMKFICSHTSINTSCS